MALSDRLPDRRTESQAHPAVRNLILLLLAVPPLLVLWGIGIAAVGVGYRMARYGALPELTGLSSVLSSEVTLLAVAAAIGYIYLIWANAVFGTRMVDAAKDQAEDIKDEVDE